MPKSPANGQRKNKNNYRKYNPFETGQTNVFSNRSSSNPENNLMFSNPFISDDRKFGGRHY